MIKKALSQKYRDGSTYETQAINAPYKQTERKNTDDYHIRC